MSSSCAQQGQNQRLMKSEEEGFAGQRRMTREEHGEKHYQMFASRILHAPLCQRELLH